LLEFLLVLEGLGDHLQSPLLNFFLEFDCSGYLRVNLPDQSEGLAPVLHVLSAQFVQTCEIDFVILGLVLDGGVRTFFIFIELHLGAVRRTDFQTESVRLVLLIGLVFWNLLRVELAFAVVGLLLLVVGLNLIALNVGVLVEIVSSCHLVSLLHLHSQESCLLLSGV